MSQPLELLAPARDLATARTAIDCGADAVYMGAAHHGARAAAGNSSDDIRQACDYAHQFGAKVYVTVNTLIYDDEFAEVEKLTQDLYEAGADALIVQDMGLLRSDLPPIALHASTQCDARTPQKAQFLANCGMSCIVLPRELSLDEIRSMRRAVSGSVRLEAFVHGALCVCYSGDCRASLVNGGRSANRGECAQICRLPFDLVDREGNVLVHDRHLLSLRDMNRLADLASMADAGVTSFKIEGRLKGADYVANVVTAYSQALDALCKASGGKYCRASLGHVNGALRANVNKAFNRGFTSYFLRDTQPSAGQLGAHATPKFVGQPVGKVVSAGAKSITAKLTAELHNGDGLGFFDGEGHFTGFRLNRVEGNTLFPATRVAVRPGTMLYRNADKAFDDALASARPVRRIAVDFVLSHEDEKLILSAEDERGACAEVSLEMPCIERAQKPQQQQQQRAATLSKLGNTIYELRDLDDTLDDVFVAPSQLAALRRQCLDALDEDWRDKNQRPERAKENPKAKLRRRRLTMHDNVANSRAREFYASHGLEVVELALEVNPRRQSGEVQVMTTRYCLRRELGACLRTPTGAKLPSPLFLRHVDGKVRPMRLDFDCANCQMHVTALAKS